MAGARTGGRVERRTDTISVGAVGDDLPVVILRAPDPDPVVAITANVHGDEVTGLAAVHALEARLLQDLQQGTVVLFPSLNPRGLIQQRRVQPDDGIDLNRVFPGDAAGSGAARVAGAVWRGLLAHEPTALLDLHADSTVAIPYIIIDRATHLRGAERQRMDVALTGLAEASGLTVLYEYPDDQYTRFRLDRSLAGAIVNHARVPAVTLEVGPRRAISDQHVNITFVAVLRMLHHLGLVADAPPPPVEAVAGGPWRRAAAPRVRRPGLFVPQLSPGSAFEKGAVLGEVRGLDGTVREVVRAEVSGLVVSWSENAWVDARGVPGTLGFLEVR